MAFNKKPLKAQDELIPYSNDLEDRVESGFDGLTKEDVGLGRVLNTKQATSIISYTTSGNNTITLENGGHYLITGHWDNGNDGKFFIFVTTRNGHAYIYEVYKHTTVDFDVNGLSLTILKERWSFVSVIRMN